MEQEKSLIDRALPGLVTVLWGIGAGLVTYWVSVEVRFHEFNERLVATRSALVDFEHRLAKVEVDQKPDETTLDIVEHQIKTMEDRLLRLEDRVSPPQTPVIQKPPSFLPRKSGMLDTGDEK